MRLILQSGDFSRDVPKVELSGKYIQRGCQQMFSYTIPSILEGFMVLSCLGVKIENGDRFFVLLLWPVVVALGTFWFPNCISAKITTMQDQHYYYFLKRK